MIPGGGGRFFPPVSPSFSLLVQAPKGVSRALTCHKRGAKRGDVCFPITAPLASFPRPCPTEVVK